MTEPTLDLAAHKTRAAAFRALHDGQVLVLTNAWDAASARLFTTVGAAAIATSSGAQSASQGQNDGNNLLLADVVANVRRIASVVDVPVSADIESGYATDLDGLAETVSAVLAAGAVGVNIEDSGALDSVLFSAQEQKERIAAVRAAAHRYGVELFINARTDVFLFGVGEEAGRLDDVIARAAAYEAAGADGIFVPGLLDLDALRTLAEATRLKLNAMWLPGAPSVDELADAGVARFSVGTALAQVAYSHAQAAARALLEDADYAALDRAAGSPPVKAGANR